MELTQKTFAERLVWLRTVVVDQEIELEQYRTGMHEKGVECAIIVPMLEVHLEFDAIRDVQYETVSITKHGQRFDFLVDGKLLIEAKMLGANLDDHYKQLERYIKGNDEINYGILTNGIDYQVWIQKIFVENLIGRKLPHTPSVVNVLQVSLVDDDVQFLLSAMSLFSKPKYESSFNAIARIAGHYAAGGRGKPPILHEDKDINEELRSRIREAVAIQKGIYYEKVMSGEWKAGDLLRYTDDNIEITVELTKTGTVMLRKGAANILNMLNALDAGWGPMVSLLTDQWSKSDTEFQDPIEIIKLAQNKQRLHNQARYDFKRLGPGAV